MDINQPDPFRPVNFPNMSSQQSINFCCSLCPLLLKGAGSQKHRNACDLFNYEVQHVNLVKDALDGLNASQTREEMLLDEASESAQGTGGQRTTMDNYRLQMRHIRQLFFLKHEQLKQAEIKHARHLTEWADERQKLHQERDATAAELQSARAQSTTEESAAFGLTIQTNDAGRVRVVSQRKREASGVSDNRRNNDAVVQELTKCKRRVEELEANIASLKASHETATTKLNAAVDAEKRKRMVVEKSSHAPQYIGHRDPDSDPNPLLDWMEARLLMQDILSNDGLHDGDSTEGPKAIPKEPELRAIYDLINEKSDRHAHAALHKRRKQRMLADSSEANGEEDSGAAEDHEGHLDWFHVSSQTGKVLQSEAYAIVRLDDEEDGSDPNDGPFVKAALGDLAAYLSRMCEVYTQAALDRRLQMDRSTPVLRSLAPNPLKRRRVSMMA